MAYVGVDPKQLHAAWEDIRLSGHLTEGKYVRLFEDAVQTWSGMSACAVNSGGTGLYAMLRLAGPPENSPVAVSTNTFYATAGMAKEAGYAILLTDCARRDMSMDFTSLVGLAVKPKAVILTHIGGRLASRYPLIADWCQHEGIRLFEDAAHALGVRDHGAVAGCLGHSAVFSLYPTKAVPAGEGGCIVSRDASFIADCKEFRNYGKYRGDSGVIGYRGRGFNFRMDEWTAAVAYLQMQRLDELLEARAEAAYALSQVIQPLPMWLSGKHACNFYKYPVLQHEVDAQKIHVLSGHVYRSTDQLQAALQLTDQGPFPNAVHVANQYCCLPLDENLYRGQTPDQIRTSICL